MFTSCISAAAFFAFGKPIFFSLYRRRMPCGSVYLTGATNVRAGKYDGLVGYRFRGQLLTP